MARYTVELGTLVDSGLNVFDFDYDFYDETKKSDFEKEFIEHFYFNEIGQETAGRFKHYLKRKFHETLPYYNMLFRTALIDYERTNNYSIVETLERAVNTDNSLTSMINTDGTSEVETDTTLDIDRNATSNATTEKESTLSTNSHHQESNETSKDEHGTDTFNNVHNANKTSDLFEVKSDTPQSLVTANNIKGNLYASEATRNDNTETEQINEQNTVNRVLTSNDNISISADDNASGNTKDEIEDNRTDEVNETQDGNTKTESSVNSSTSTSQDSNSDVNETSTRNLSGFNGSLTQAEMLQKHIALQKTLTTIMTKFFDECDDLFMLVLN